MGVGPRESWVVGRVGLSDEQRESWCWGERGGHVRQAAPPPGQHAVT